jgi:glycosyltransferase involved in cell wall biosynthesis
MEDKSTKIIFSIFTPVYNRSHLITRVYNSLVKQTIDKFERIVVDDGSDDDIDKKLQMFKKEAYFPIKIIRQKNSGKHIAWNNALKIARGELFIPADSDDEFLPETLQTFYDIYYNLPRNIKENIYGVCVLCKDQFGKIVGDIFPLSPFITTNLDLAFKYKIRGEKWGCLKTEILKKYLFPNVASTHFPESYIWFQLSRDYYIYCVNIPLRIYYINEGRNLCEKPNYNIRKKRAAAYFYYQMWLLNECNDYLFLYHNFLDLIKEFTKTWLYCLLIRSNPLRVIIELKDIKSKLFSISTFFLGVISLIYIYIKKFISHN